MTVPRNPTSANTSAHDTVLVVDFGSQVTQLIARRVREAGVYCEVVPFQNSAGAVADIKPKAIILSGGPASVHETTSPKAAAEIAATTDIDPPGDIHASAKYRRHLAKVLARQVLAKAGERANGD